MGISFSFLFFLSTPSQQFLNVAVTGDKRHHTNTKEETQEPLPSGLPDTTGPCTLRGQVWLPASLNARYTQLSHLTMHNTATRNQTLPRTTQTADARFTPVFVFEAFSFCFLCFFSKLSFIAVWLLYNEAFSLYHSLSHL